MSQRPNWVITVDELPQKRLQAVLLDIRNDDEVAMGIIPDSIHIPLDQLENRALEELNPEIPVIVYCARGSRSLEGILTLKQLGFTKVYSLEGGITAWNEKHSG